MISLESPGAGRGKEDSPLPEAPEGAEPCQHLDFELLTSRRVRG